MYKDEKEIYKIIGMNLKRIRKAANMSVEELAEKSTYSVGFIMNIESNKYLQSLSLGTLFRFANILGVKVSEFFKD